MTQHSDMFTGDVEGIIATGWPFITERIPQNWRKLPPTALEKIKGRRSALVSILQHRFAPSRAHSWLQVEKSFAQLK